LLAVYLTKRGRWFDPFEIFEEELRLKELPEKITFENKSYWSYVAIVAFNKAIQEEPNDDIKFLNPKLRSHSLIKYASLVLDLFLKTFQGTEKQELLVSQQQWFNCIRYILRQEKRIMLLNFFLYEIYLRQQLMIVTYISSCLV
jgi:hypothetical protein